MWFRAARSPRLMRLARATSSAGVRSGVFPISVRYCLIVLRSGWRSRSAAGATRVLVAWGGGGSSAGTGAGGGAGGSTGLGGGAVFTTGLALTAALGAATGLAAAGDAGAADRALVFGRDFTMERVTIGR